MTWGKIDDNLAFHPKVAMAGNEAMGLWVRAMSYSCQQLTDGFIPDVIVQSMNGANVAERLIEVGLWHREEGGYRFNDWGDYQLSAESERERRSKMTTARSEAGRLGASKRWQTDGKPYGKPMANAMANEWQNDSPIPIPEPIPLESAKRASRLSPNFVVTEEMAVWAKRETPSVNITAETAKFIDHHIAKGSSFKDWVAAWRNWMRRSREFGGNITTETIDAARADRERRMEEHERQKRERAEAAEKATPPPECKHGKTIITCLECSLELANQNG